MNPSDLLRRLFETGRVKSRQAVLTPLSGGVSSEIFLVEDGASRFVVKRALPKLRVQDEWLADPARNAVEHDFIEYVSGFAPEQVPEIVFHDREAGMFGMEYFGQGFANWKGELLRGVLREEDAARAGSLAGRIHRNSWGDEKARARFSTWPNFFALRVEAYLLTTGRRNPVLREFFEAEAERLETTSVALVQGDYSPKNILVSGARLVLLDSEAAWFGEPAFDAAFLLNHLYLKSIHRPADREGYLRLASRFWSAYGDAMGAKFSRHLEERTARLLLMLLLARVDGKSPVEYLTEESKRTLIRDFAAKHLPDAPREIAEIERQWRAALKKL